MVKRLKPAILGILSLVPLVCMAFAAIWPEWRQRRWAEQFEREYGYDPFDPSLNWRDVPWVEEFGVSIDALVVAANVALVGLIVALAMIIYFSRKALRSETLDKTQKRLWVAALIVGNLIALPVAWYVFVWKERTSKAPPPGG